MTLRKWCGMLALVALAGGMTGCDRLAGLFGGDDERAAIEQDYAKFRAAVLAADLPAVRGLVAREKVGELSRPEALQQLQLAAALYPASITVRSVAVQGDRATLVASGAAQEGTAQGTVQLVREDGRWKVLDEAWEVKLDVAAAAPPPPAAPKDDTPRPDAGEFAKLRGQWSGPEVTGGADWIFSFGDGYAVVVRTPMGDGYEGRAAVHFELGPQPVRVPPGAGVVDVDITSASAPGFQGKTSLGVYLSAGPQRMKFCASRPGHHLRPESFETSTADLRCFDLARISDQPLPGSSPGPAVPAPGPAPATPATPWEWNKGGDPAVKGGAKVVLDGASVEYGLLTNFFSDTRLKEPTHAVVHFQPRTATDHTSGLVLTLDATQAGTHVAEGDQDRVGEQTPDGPRALLQWIAEGGQVFFPKGTCAIRVTKPYTGSPDGEFAGTIADCTVHSGGIDRQLSAVVFTVNGAATVR